MIYYSNLRIEKNNTNLYIGLFFKDFRLSD